MPETPLGITYPAETDHTRLWEHFQSLAESVDGVVGGAILTGTVECVGTGAPNADGDVTFPVPFAGAPIVQCTPYNNSYAAATAASLSSSGFIARIRRVDNAPLSANTTVHWLAVGVPA